MLSFYNYVRYFIEISIEKQNKCGDRSHYGVVVVAVVGSREEIRKKNNGSSNSNNRNSSRKKETIKDKVGN